MILLDIIYIFRPRNLDMVSSNNSESQNSECNIILKRCRKRGYRRTAYFGQRPFSENGLLWDNGLAVQEK